MALFLFVKSNLYCWAGGVCWLTGFSFFFPPPVKTKPKITTKIPMIMLFQRAEPSVEKPRIKGDKISQIPAKKLSQATIFITYLLSSRLKRDGLMMILRTVYIIR